MHPVIRIVCYLVLGAFLSLGAWRELGVAGVLLAAVYRRLDAHDLAAAWRLLRRMRWLFLSILILYLWFTPMANGSVGRAWLPSAEGAALALQHVLVLVVLVLAVNALLRSTPPPELVGALLWLLRPLQRVGISQERLAVRIGLTLRAVEELHGLLIQVRVARKEEPAAFTLRERVERFAGYAAGVFQLTLQYAQRADLEPIAVEPAPICPWQWSWPLALLCILWGAGYF